MGASEADLVRRGYDLPEIRKDAPHVRAYNLLKDGKSAQERQEQEEQAARTPAILLWMGAFGRPGAPTMEERAALGRIAGEPPHPGHRVNLAPRPGRAGLAAQQLSDDEDEGDPHEGRGGRGYANLA